MDLNANDTGNRIATLTQWIPTIYVAKVKAASILTVGESEQFTQQGGIINFTKKDGKVRLEIDLNAAKLAKLELSSKLLSVADSIHGKP